MDAVRLEIDGMTCGHCVASVRRAVESVEGATPESVQVGRANVEYDADRISVGTIIAAIANAGYPARVAEHSR